MDSKSGEEKSVKCLASQLLLLRSVGTFGKKKKEDYFPKELNTTLFVKQRKLHQVC